MSAMATLDAARENAEAVSRLLDQYLGSEDTGKNVEDVLRFARFLWLVVRDAWEGFQVQLDAGMEAGQARRAAASAVRACESLVRVVGRLDAARAAGDVREYAELTDAAARARAIQQAAQELVRILEAPEPLLDPTRLAEGLSAAQRGELEDTEAIVARLKTGGSV